MPEFDKNAAYIWASYGLGALMIAGAWIQVWLTARSARARLARLEDETGDSEAPG